MKEYVGMFKKYFTYKGSYQTARKEAQKLFDSVSSINTQFAVDDYPAFIVYCDELLQKLAAIRKINTEINVYSCKLPSVAKEQFVKQALVEEIHQTNEIENVNSTRKEIKDALMVVENGRKGKRFDGMIRKYQMLMGNQSIPLLSCQDIRTLYDSFVLDEVLNEDPEDAPDGLYFRKNTVSVIKRGQEIHQGVYPESKLNSAMEQALLFLNDADYDPLIRIAGFHYMFGYIHPFYNGNGRMSRFISSYKLTAEGIHILVALRLSYIIKGHRAKYYNLFKTTNDRRNFGDVTLFVITFLDFVEMACNEVSEFLKQKSGLLDHYTGIINRCSEHPDVQLLLSILMQVSVCDGDSLSLAELEKASGMSKYLINKHMDTISPLCQITHKGRTKLYSADLAKLDALAEAYP